jgi:hypothetical protein
MIDQDFILLIMNCKKYKEKALYQKSTWLNHIPETLIYYHVIGDENLDKDYTIDNESRILWVKTKDDYNSLPHKVISAYEAMTKTYKFKYIFKTDDDQILVNNKFFNIIQNLVLKKKDPKTHYGGYLVDVKTPYLSKYNLIHPELPNNMIIQKTRYCSGRFYYISYEAIIYLLVKKPEIQKEYLEDYAIGFYLHPCFKENMLTISTNTYFTDIEKSDFMKKN